MTGSELMNDIQKYIKLEANETVFEKDCKILEFLFKNCEITFPEDNRFFGEVNFATIGIQVYYARVQEYGERLKKSEYYDGHVAGAFSGTFDFSHTTPEWDVVINRGFVGLIDRIEDYARKNTDENKRSFYELELRVYRGILGFLERASKEAFAQGRQEIGEGLSALAKRAPKTLYEAMQITIVYYVLQHIFEGTFLRTLGRIDTLFYPFAKNEDEEAVKTLLLDYLHEIDKLKAPANIPFAIGGTDIDGRSLVNPLSYMIVDAYRKAGTNNTKFHLLCSKNMPEDLIAKTFEAVREGNNSVVFLSDEKLIECLIRHGAEHSDAVDYHVVGCYEVGAKGELASTTNGRVNYVKALEYALNRGYDARTGKTIGLEHSKAFETFEELYDEVKRQLEHLCICSMRSSEIFEKHYDKIHSSPILSGTYTSALEKGGDLYCDHTPKYANSSINVIGLATLVDSLIAIKKLVYQDKALTLERFVEILNSNWEGEEALRLTVKNKFPKFGTNNDEVDSLAKDIVDATWDYIGLKPSVKGGIWRFGPMSINWRWEYGGKTGASADGRLSGETLSQNASATFGADRDGATAHLLSVAKLDASKTANATVVDIDLHSSAVKGENGNRALVSTLKTFFELGGFGVHYNVLNTEVLKKARENPDAYPNLQVRLCGWNVLFSSLSDKEKDEFIERSMK